MRFRRRMEVHEQAYRYLTLGGAVVEVPATVEASLAKWTCRGCDAGDDSVREYRQGRTNVSAAKAEANAHASGCRAMPKRRAS